MYAEKILEIITPMTMFASSILGRHCAALGKSPADISREDLSYLAVAIGRSISLFAGSERGDLAAARIGKLRGSDPQIRPSTFPQAG